MDYKAMTYEELVAIKDSIQLELLRRESEERQQAINDFKKGSWTLFQLPSDRRQTRFGGKFR